MSFQNTGVTLDAFFPNLSVSRIDPQTRTVGSQLEFPDIAQWDLPDDDVFLYNADIDVSSSKIALTVDEEGFSFSDGQLPDLDVLAGEFNGIVLTFSLGGFEIQDASLSVDDFGLPNNGLFFNGHSIYLNAAGLEIQDGDKLEIDVSFIDKEDALINFDDTVFTARLYSAAFGRQPDQDGLNFWINNFDAVGRIGMSELFLESGEFQSRYGVSSDLTNEEYLDVLYNNILGRDGDIGGMNFWLDALDRNVVTKAETLSYFVDSEENISNTREFENVGRSAENGEWFLLS